MHRKTLRLPIRFSSVIPSDPDIALPSFEPEPQRLSVQAETVAEIALPQMPPEPTVEERLTELLRKLNRIASDIRVERKQETSIATRAIVDLVVRATRHLVGRKIQTGEYDLEAMISQALRKLDASSAVVVALHPEDLRLLQMTAAGLSAREGIAWEADASLSRGSFRVQANDVSLWSDLETRLQEVRDALEQSLEAADTSRDDGIADEEAA